ncbi:MAG: BlaI/MecI/CopY family transcriptional regulator [Catenulispora sp.]|nr:BlaI/MecI/CopY family transcriptional regulator [Catenulispora sp.]NUR61033.1 BlaI/MecI/CopY family transcriptional regulator [Catenulispora sp.]
MPNDRPSEPVSRRAAGELENSVLAVLLAAGGPLSPGEVRDGLSGAGGDLAYTTVVTILTRLHAKGVLTRCRHGRAFRYAPVADEAGLAARSLSALLDRQADREAVLTRFVADLSDHDEELLRRLLAGGGTSRIKPGGA